MIVDELKDFRNKLMKYIVYRKKWIIKHEKLTTKEQADFGSIYEEISISAGKYAPLVKEFTGLETIPTSAGSQDVWNWAFNFEANPLVVHALDNCLQATSRTIGGIEEEIKKGIRDKSGNKKDKPQKEVIEKPKAFIAHEGETKALDKLKAFLDALGVTHLIAEIEPSNGRLVEGQVDWSQGQADFAIILATKGKVVSKKTGKPQIGTNVADELGRARQVFKNRIILLRQTGVEVHTNVSGISREHFSPQSMDRAFIKIAKELRNWGFLITRKVEE